MSVVSQAILLGFSNSSATSEAYWYATIGDASSNKGYDVRVDSSKNVYLSGSSYPDEMIVVKYDASGSLQWQRKITGDESEITSLGLDSSNNVYVFGNTETNSQGGRDFYVAKLNTSGTLQWQRGLGSGGTYSTDESIGHSATDSSGNTYGCGYSGALDKMLLFKYNGSGTLQWQRQLSLSGQQAFHSDVVLDSSGNVYAAGETDLNTLNDSHLTLVKYNSSGTLQWQKRLAASSPNEVALGVDVDSSDNVYVCGTSNFSSYPSNKYIIIAKFNSSGSLQWARTLSFTTFSTVNKDIVAERIRVDGSDNLYISGHTEAEGQGSDDLFVIKLPNDGSLTGTHGSFTYAVSSFTVTTSMSMTEANLGLTGANGTLTDYAQSLTVSTSSFTSATTSL